MINFENNTENFESFEKKALSPLNFLTSKIILVNGNSKRLTIPIILRNRFLESDKVRLFYKVETGDCYIDFQFNSEQIVPEKVEFKDVKIIKTGWSYFITLPTKWFKYIKPTKASLTQLDIKKTVYKVDLYD